MSAHIAPSDAKCAAKAKRQRRRHWWIPVVFAEKNGAAEGTRTPDPIITNDVLYQLSYSGILLRRWRLPAPLSDRTLYGG
jgi:hypothetical protein